MSDGGVSGYLPRTGIDIVEIARIERAIERSGDHFKNRIFTVKEQRFCDRRPHAAASYAVRFAAKEAVMKVLGEGVFKIPLTDIEVGGGGDTRPTIALHRKAQMMADKIGVTAIDISLAHEKTHAIATAMALIIIK